jgi:hypothetical protein
MSKDDKLDKLMAEAAQGAKSMKSFSSGTGVTYDDAYGKSGVAKKPTGDNLIGNISKIIGFATILFSLFICFYLTMAFIHALLRILGRYMLCHLSLMGW